MDQLGALLLACWLMLQPPLPSGSCTVLFSQAMLVGSLALGTALIQIWSSWLALLRTLVSSRLPLTLKGVLAREVLSPLLLSFSVVLCHCRSALLVLMLPSELN